MQKTFLAFPRLTSDLIWTLLSAVRVARRPGRVAQPASLMTHGW